jgi:arsenical pump membrane protein
MMQQAVWAIAALSTVGVLVRPWRLPEATWAVCGAVVLVVAGLLSWRDALKAVREGTDVYLFLTGMMLFAEVAQSEGLFDFLASHAVRLARGSATKLFVLIYIVGTLVTVIMSNDATAVVLTPAVFAATKAAKVRNPLPFLFICAFVANAASFVLPISNPANLVLFQMQMPALPTWLGRFGLPSILSIAATFLALWFTQRRNLLQQVDTPAELPSLSAGGRAAAFGIAAAAGVLMTASALDRQLGLPTLATAAATAVVVLFISRKSPRRVLAGITWHILLLVAGLFVLVEALDHTRALEAITGLLQESSSHSLFAATWSASGSVAIICNLVNNLPAALIASSALRESHAGPQITSAMLIGVDLGPNLSVTGSLATILWLAALRREKQNVSAWTFLKLGSLMMPSAFALAIVGLLAASLFRLL